MNLPDAEDLINFIVTKYNRAERIVEIGVGAYPWIAERVKELLPITKVIVTDIDREKLSLIKKMCPSLETVYDDLFEPQLKVYYGADLILSVRPPPEIIPEVLKLASKLGCDLLIRPYLNEEGDYDYPKRYGWRLTSHKRAVFYIRRSKQAII